MFKRILCLIGVLSIFVTNPIYANTLAIGKFAKTTGPIDIAINPPAELNFKSRAEILRLRAEQILRHPELMSSPYLPSTEVFGNLEDNKPWWGIYGQGYFGQGQNSIKGPAEESRFILNPYLLVGEAMICGVDKSQFTEQDLISKNVPMFYSPGGLRWWPKEGRAEVTYDVSAYKSRLATILGFSNFTISPNLTLEAINARDLGLTYYYLPPQWVTNIHLGSPMNQPLPVNQFIHCGGSCGYPGGCNNMSPRVEQLDNLAFTQLPARISIMFWQKPPTTGKEKPDMIYTINYK